VVYWPCAVVTPEHDTRGYHRVRIKKLALAVSGLAVGAAPQTLASFSWGATQQSSFIEDEEVLEMAAGSKADIVISAG
jgi:hypothetical protein